MADLRFRSLKPADLMRIEPQPSQHIQIGLHATMTDELAEELADQSIAWTAMVAHRPIACFGIAEQFEGRQGLGWAILSEGIGSRLLPITRFARYEIETARLARIELLAIGPNIEAVLARLGRTLDAGELVALARMAPTPQMRWAELLGMAPGHVMRCFGAMSETYILYERISPPNFGKMALVERAA